MILGIGVDLAKISRFKKLVLKESFLTKFFNPSEIEYINNKGAGAAQSLAGSFAAREAFFKALGTGFRGFSSRDISVIRDPMGKPEIIPSDKLLNILKSKGDSWKIHLSISHEKEYAVAQVLIEV